MKRILWPTRDSVKDYFPLPKEIFSLGLSAAEIAIYAYLLFCEDRQTFQCWPSYRKIGGAVGLSPNTICKHIRSLEERGLLVTEPTMVTTKDGRKRNGNLSVLLMPGQFENISVNSRIPAANQKLQCALISAFDPAHQFMIAVFHRLTAFSVSITNESTQRDEKYKRNFIKIITGPCVCFQLQYLSAFIF